MNNTHGQYNLHYILMVGGFIFLNGQCTYFQLLFSLSLIFKRYVCWFSFGIAMLAYRSFQCCKKIYVKVLHTIFFVLAISAITIGLVAAIQAANNIPNGKHFYTMHSWIGLAAIGLFALQVIVFDSARYQWWHYCLKILLDSKGLVKTKLCFSSCNFSSWWVLFRSWFFFVAILRQLSFVNDFCQPT